MSSRGLGYPPAEVATLHPDHYTKQFWEAAAGHRLVCQRCTQCKTPRMPPCSHCYNCQSASSEFIELPGTGTVYSFTIVRESQLPAITAAAPFVVALVELDGAPGCRLFTNVVDVEPDKVEIGQAVTVVWDDVRSGVTIPRFRLR